MKLLVSDYDGTLKPYINYPTFKEKNTFEKNIQNVNKFILKGNKFMISTKRNTKSILEEINKYKIIYNYLSTYNGRVIFDKNNQIIYVSSIDKNILEYIFDKKYIFKSTYLYNPFEMSKTMDNIIYSKIYFYSEKDLLEFYYDIIKLYSNLKIDCNILENSLTIRTNFNKLLGIEKLIEKENLTISNNDIITVGDGKNDLEMIEYYDGYRMLKCNEDLLDITNNVTSSVHKLIKQINKRK